MNDKSAPTTAICFSASPKTAALYFDKVIPLSLGGKDRPSRSVLKELLPVGLWDGSPKKDVTEDYLDVLKKLAIAFVYGNHEGVDSIKFDTAIKEFWLEADKLLLKHNLKDASILLNSATDTSKTSKSDDVLVTLSGLPLVNVSNTSWEQIIEFRKDRDAHQKLKRLKVFLRETYDKKDKFFIQDDLETRIYQYSQSVKDWGFETKTSAISQLLSSKLLLGTSGAVLASIFGEKSALAALAATGGACVEIGKFSLHMAKRQYGLLKFKRDHPLGYIIDAIEHLETSGENVSHALGP